MVIDLGKKQGQKWPCFFVSDKKIRRKTAELIEYQIKLFGCYLDAGAVL